MALRDRCDLAFFKLPTGIVISITCFYVTQLTFIRTRLAAADCGRVARQRAKTTRGWCDRDCWCSACWEQVVGRV